MYSTIPYAIAQGLVEIPYIAAQTILYGITTYFMINFQKTIGCAGKFLLYLVFMFSTFTYFTIYGMLAIGLTPSQQMAAVVFVGFLVPKPLILGWWKWILTLKLLFSMIAGFKTKSNIHEAGLHRDVNTTN